MNKPSAPFSTPYKITMEIDFSDWIADRRRIEGELWCYDNTQHPWFRRILIRLGVVEFHFADRNEATMFWLAN